jgi:hypothetical protein
VVLVFSKRPARIGLGQEPWRLPSEPPAVPEEVAKTARR